MTAALIVDDEPAILRLVAMVLREMGCETMTAGDAEAASELLKSSKPDLIVTDIRLPGASGIELARKVKASKRLKNTPVLLMSAFSEPREHGGDGFIAKPFDICELEEAFAPYLNTNGDGVAGPSSEHGQARPAQRAHR